MHGTNFQFFHQILKIPICTYSKIPPRTGAHLSKSSVVQCKIEILGEHEMGPDRGLITVGDIYYPPPLLFFINHPSSILHKIKFHIYNQCAWIYLTALLTAELFL